MIRIISLVILSLVTFASCAEPTSNTNTKVKISTSYGDIVLLLYDDTPAHRDNFIKLIKDGFYDGLLFHRVIDDFMIQGGDPNSRTAAANTLLGMGDVGYTIPAEFVHVHTQGALAAARMGDGMNPEKRSSGCQFYIVEGTPQTEQSLNNCEEMRRRKIEYAAQRQIFHDSPELTAQLQEAQASGDYSAFLTVKATVDSLVTVQCGEQLQRVQYTAEQRAKYLQNGGTPNLDFDYSVFGEVVEGIDVIKKIAEVATDSNNRPTEDIKMKIRILK